MLNKKGPTGSRTQVAGFKVQSANHYTIEPHFCLQNQNDAFYVLTNKIMCLCIVSKIRFPRFKKNKMKLS